MDRCPNCGATVRSGAKFCTTCGMRLPETAPASQSSESAPRSPFDSTSTVASRWPSRSIYGTADLTPQDAADQSADGGATAEEPATQASAEPADAVVDQSPSETTTSTWGGWTPPNDTPSDTTATDASSSSGWGTASAAEGDAASEAAADTTQPKSGETDFLSLPEQPDPSAWATIESQLRGESASVVADESASEVPTNDTSPVDAPPVDESPAGVVSGDAEEEIPEAHAADAEVGEKLVAAEASSDEIEEEVAATPEVSPSAERANELLDELRAVIVGMSLSSAQVESPQPSLPSFEDVKPTAEEIAQFATLRAAVDAATEKPRDIDTMLDISGRLDAIKALHDAFNRLNDAISSTGSNSGDSSTDE